VLKKRIISLSAGVLATAVTASAAFGATDTGTASLPTLSIAVNGKSITLPRTVPAGAVNVITNVTEESAGAPALVKLQPGVTVQKVFQVIQKAHGDPQAIKGYASIVFDRPSPKGKTSTQTVLTPGNYAALDFAPNGQPPTRLFTVTRSSRSTQLPKPDATITMKDFAFTGPSTLLAGELVRFRNAGKVLHMAVGARFKTMADATKAAEELKAGNDKAAEKLAIGEVSFMDTNSPGAMQQETIDVKPGVYVLACFMATNGKEHTRLGMERVITITPSVK
jgi:plastocyanin